MARGGGSDRRGRGRARERSGALAAAVLATVGLLATACSSSSASSTSSASSGALLVVATTTQLADFARQVGGSRIDVVSLLKPNVDAHEYEPSPADVQRIGKAALVIRNGLGLDSWVDKAVQASGTKAVRTDASTGVPTRTERGEPDPHIWMDPRNARIMVTDIAAALASVDQQGRATYEANRDAYLAQLDVLDAEIGAQLAPLTNRKVVTNHDAFGYFLAHYGLEYVGSVIPSFDTQAELSASELKDLVDRIRATGVTVIFTETSLPPKTARTIAAEAGVKVVQGADALYGDSLGLPGSGADTYLGMMRKNATTFAENLR